MSKIPAHRRTETLPRDAGFRPGPPPAKVLPNDPDPEPAAAAPGDGAPAAPRRKAPSGR